jgi:hypothetical protein
MTEMSRLGQFAVGPDLIRETFWPLRSKSAEVNQYKADVHAAHVNNRRFIDFLLLSAERRTVAKVKTVNWIRTSNLVGMVLVDALIDFWPCPYPFCSLPLANKRNFKKPDDAMSLSLRKLNSSIISWHLVDLQLTLTYG